MLLNQFRTLLYSRFPFFEFHFTLRQKNSVRGNGLRGNLTRLVFTSNRKSNSLVKCFNRTLKFALTSRKNDWLLLLPMVFLSCVETQNTVGITVSGCHGQNSLCLADLFVSASCNKQDLNTIIKSIVSHKGA